MSLFHWFSSRKKRNEPQPSVMPSSGLSRLDSTRPAHAARPRGTAAPANRKQERMERRELLYLVVRESMVRAGVLSSTYKFKVLSLDARGRQFLVLVDLSAAGGLDTPRLAEIEAMIAQAAKARFDILVTAVYWRSNEHVAVGEFGSRGSGASARPGHHGEELVLSDSAPLTSPATLPDHLRTQPLPAMAAAGDAARRASMDPLHPSEVEAFHRALGASLRGEQALVAAGGGAAREHSYTLLTGFEDTEMATEEAGPDLSGTQYGELR